MKTVVLNKIVVLNDYNWCIFPKVTCQFFSKK